MKIAKCLLGFIALSSVAGVLAAFKLQPDQATCVIYRRSITSQNLCTVPVQAVRTSPVYPGQPAWGTTHLTSLTGPCPEIKTYYACS